AVDVSDDRSRRFLRPTLRPVFQRDEGLSGVNTLPRKAEAGEEGDAIDGRLCQQISFHLLDRGFSAGIRRIRRGLHVGSDKTLIVDGQKATRQPNEREGESDE